MEWFCAIGQAPRSVWSGGCLFERDYRAERGACSGDVDPWPNHKAMSLACHPLDKYEFERDASRRGVPTEFGGDEPMLMPQFRSAGHKKKYLRAYGLVDYDAYY